MMFESLLRSLTMSSSSLFCAHHNIYHPKQPTIDSPGGQVGNLLFSLILQCWLKMCVCVCKFV